MIQHNAPKQALDSHDMPQTCLGEVRSEIEDFFEWRYSMASVESQEASDDSSDWEVDDGLLVGMVAAHSNLCRLDRQSIHNGTTGAYCTENLHETLVLARQLEPQRSVPESGFRKVSFGLLDANSSTSRSLPYVVRSLEKRIG